MAAISSKMMRISMDFTFTALMKPCQNFKHGFPNFQARISDRQARPCLFVYTDYWPLGQSEVPPKVKHF